MRLVEKGSEHHHSPPNCTRHEEHYISDPRGLTDAKCYAVMSQIGTKKSRRGCVRCKQRRVSGSPTKDIEMAFITRPSSSPSPCCSPVLISSSSYVAAKATCILFSKSSLLSQRNISLTSMRRVQGIIGLINAQVKCDEEAPCSNCHRRNEECSLLDFTPATSECSIEPGLPTTSEEWIQDL